MPLPDVVTMLVTAQIALTQIIVFLPASLPNRGLLAALALLPILALLQVHRGASWKAESGSSQFGDDDVLTGAVHPILVLAAAARSRVSVMLQRQSKTLAEAVAEYKSRYKRPPPPGFDAWFNLALRNDFLLVDEFDVTMEALELFWGLPPLDVRARAETALASSPDDLGWFSVQNHEIHWGNGALASWMGEEIFSWFTAEILAMMPDVRFAVNFLDEPRVCVAYDTLEAAIHTANDTLGRQHSIMWKDTTGVRKVPVDFHHEGKQRAWEDLVLSCPLDSACRVESNEEKITTTSADLGFVRTPAQNKDVCSHPSLREQHGFFSTAETLRLTRTLVPIFSQGKPSSFQDILYPSPWYSAKDRLNEYVRADDVDWNLKADTLYWTGSTTGGHTTIENWQHFHRQRMYLLTNSGSEQQITLLQSPSEKHGVWTPYTTNMSTVASLFETRITDVIQCDPPACDIQREIFNVPEERKDKLSKSYHYKFNLDIDGNGFSGRFYRLLKSKSVPIKQTMFKEWHDDWLIPWAHYIPLSMEMTEMPEMMRFLATTEEGRELSQRIAEDGAEWARKVLRQNDLVLTFVRLLLEYARIISPDRANMRCCD
jgi:Glycosyl transferase family 90